MHLVENGVQYENNHGLSEGSTTKMSKIQPHDLNGTKGEKLPYVQTFEKKKLKKKIYIYIYIKTCYNPNS